MSLCNAVIGFRTACPFTLRLFAVGWKAFEHRNGAPDIAPVIAAVTTNYLQPQKRKHMLFKETTRAGAHRLLKTTSAAIELFKKPAPRGSGNEGQGTPPGRTPF